MRGTSPWSKEGGARMMELAGVATGAKLLHMLGKQGRIYADHQGLVHQLTDLRRMR